MATSLTTSGAYDALADPQPLNGSALPVLGTVARLAVDPDHVEESRDLLIRLLERRDELSPIESEFLESLTVRLGLFPYVRNAGSLSTGDQIALEFHRPPSLENEEFIFHEVQQQVYYRLMSGESVILSAPTSFGKSVISDALVASEKWDHIAIVVPTLALIDETRRRLARFSGRYKINTFPSQPVGDRTLLVMTQERLLEVEELPDIGLFIIDEFYKLDGASADRTRTTLLNMAWDRLKRTGAQFYLTGPNVTGLDNALPDYLRDALIVTDFRTVAVDVKNVPEASTEEERVRRVVSEVSEPSLVFCRTPARVREVAEWIIQESAGREDLRTSAADAADWVAENYDADWVARRALDAGIGLHHARIPRALQHHTVRLFNNGALDFLICTSTLIEGVNTAARNVLVVDSRLNRKPLDYFTFSNIRGRAGRMFRHFVGNVYLFTESPEPETLTIDIPIASQSKAASNASLLQLPDAELSPSSRDRLKPFVDQRLLSLETLRANRGIDPQKQLDLASAISNMSRRDRELLSWGGIPTYDQTVAVADLVLTHLVEAQQRGRVNARSLATRLNVVRRANGNVPEMVESQLPFSSSRDDAVEDVLFFLRNWMGHIFPSTLMALDRIQREVLERSGGRPGNYAYFAREVESQFLPPYFVTLEEYGLPVPVSLKLRALGLGGDSLDEVLLRLRSAAAHPNVSSVLTGFEEEMLDEVVTGLGPQMVG